MTEIIWHGMTRAELDAAYNNGLAVKNSAEKIAEWTARSVRLRQERPETLDIPYGPKPRNRIDIFRSGHTNAPLFAFIHGGYWQRNSKEVFSCVAEGPLALGFDVALIGYTLAPEATLTEIVGEVRAALRWLRQHDSEHGISADRILVSGWSAGGHLTTMALGEADAGLSISGVFDLEPCRLNYLNDALHLSENEVQALSPIRQQPLHSGRPLIVAFGDAELPELQRQSRDYHDACIKAGAPSELMPLTGHDHFSIIEELASPDGKLAQAAARLMR
jgi:acetyl esterase/lipase